MNDRETFLLFMDWLYQNTNLWCNSLEVALVNPDLWDTSLPAGYREALEFWLETRFDRGSNENTGNPTC